MTQFSIPTYIVYLKCTLIYILNIEGSITSKLHAYFWTLDKQTISLKIYHNIVQLIEVRPICKV